MLQLCYITTEQIKVYFNRSLIATFDITDIECFANMGERLIINLSTGDLAGTLPDDVNEVNMYVDYVRVYSLSNTYVTLSDQSTETLLPEYYNGFACVADRKFLLYPKFAENTQNTAMYWSSSDTSIAKVENGYIETVKNGECVISATDVNENQIINFTLTVKDNAGVLATSITVTSSIRTISAGGSTDVTATIYPVNCDVLTPTLKIVSGSEYCTVDGTTIKNTNSSGEDQDVVVRVGTNNSNVYQDITITLKTSVNYNVSPTDNLMCNYNISGVSTSGNVVSLQDSVGGGNTLIYTTNLSFDGAAISASNSIWTPKNAVITNDIPEEFTLLTLVIPNDSNVRPVVHGTGLNKYDGSNEYPLLYNQNTLCVYQDTSRSVNLSVGDMSSQKIVIGETFSSNREITACLVTSNGTLYKTDSVVSLYESVSSMGEIRAFTNAGGQGFVGSFYQILVFNKVLSDEEIVSFANQMFEKN